ncbi:fumarylacetoacetase [Nocardia huaxiensis]|uniref:fumarylacetoacetase n=1 Tax=Nocardia huaxiensis TaxID=2755382 RepID=UPI001E555B50|nr:fumarylacetoacetase [Nocardia huaxiensis]UFS94195.1 fumarylacetoacetase [Nocardia huaxiensis]
MSSRVRIEVPEDSGFGPTHLPYCVFRPRGGEPRVGARLGDSIIDLAVALDDPMFAQPSLNAFMTQGPQCWREVRELVHAAAETELPAAAVHSVRAVQLDLPVEIGDYVDFYASLDHATAMGRMLRPDGEPLLPNWKHLPVGYHGRAGTVVVSGTAITRPHGQLRTASGAPEFGPTRRLDIEAELGFLVGSGSPLGTPLRTGDFAEHIFGVALVNDWSARDIQGWEAQPLGPFLGKSFATTLSAWVTPLDALAAARIPLPAQDPAPLPYLQDSAPWSLDIDLGVEWNGQIVSTPPFRRMYWSPAQMLVHMTVNGASTRTGDLFASGTISGPERHERGSLMELTWAGTDPVDLNGDKRTFLEDGDEIAITASAPAVGGGRLTLGEVRGRITRQ